MTAPNDVLAVDAALTSRHSCRQFLDRPVSSDLVSEILDVATRAPSGHNSQPWQVHVLMGASLRRFTTAILIEFDDPARHRAHVEDNDVYPTEWHSPYIERRRATGAALYESLNIKRGDKARMHEQMRKNYDFFGAPVGLIFTLEDTRMRSMLDYGMFMQNIMIAARARGMDTCPQAAFAIFHRAVHAALQLPSNIKVVCGMALGFGDRDAPVNRFRTSREAASAFTIFHQD
jgi:nitroreductase